MSTPADRRGGGGAALKDTWQVVLGGVGGQGLIFAGLLLGEAAAVHDGKNAAQTQSYGIETRGGFSKSEIVISSGEIVYPAVTSPDLIIILAQTAFDKLAGEIPSGSVVIYDSSIRPACETLRDSGARFYEFPLKEEAAKCGVPQAANIVALGAAVGLTGVIRGESLEKALASKFSGAVLEKNITAFRKGVGLAGKVA
jgi:2-oxoglutarate ferredoxin oxidoreductase subunit gamma